jgi:hypothetical protein
MKKIYLIAAVFVIVAITIVVSLVFFGQEKSQTEETNNQTTVSLPVGMPQESSIQVKNVEDSTQIKDSYEKYVGQDINNFPYYIEDGISQAYSVDDGKGNLVDLKTFSNSIDAKLNSKLIDMIGTSYYGFFYCPNKKGEKNFGVTFELGNSDPQKLESVNSQAKDILRQWEPYMLKDLHNILFPGKNFSEEQISQPIVFKEGKFRYAEVSLPGEEKSSINYVVDIYPPDHPSSTNLVYITTSKDCLQKSLYSLFDF